MKHFFILLSCLICFSLKATTSSDIAALKLKAQKGDAAAQVELADHYRDGKGVHKSYPQYVRLLEDAAANGNSLAQARLATYYYYGYLIDVDNDKKKSPIKQNYNKARFWAKKAADNNNFIGYDILSELYMNGLGGLSKNLERANALATKAQKLKSEFLRGGISSHPSTDEVRALYQKQIKALKQEDFRSYLYCSSSYGRNHNYDLIRASFEEGVSGFKNGSQLAILDVQFVASDDELHHFVVTLRATNELLSSFNVELKIFSSLIYEEGELVIFMEKIL